MAKKKKVTKTATFDYSGPQIQISSIWKCKFQKFETVKVKGSPPVTEWKWAFSEGPTKNEGSCSISYSIPSGAKIKSASISATYQEPWAGTSLFTLNGGNFMGSASITLSGNSGSVTCRFQYKANGKVVTNESQQSCTLVISKVTLKITYEDGEGENEENPEQPDNGTLKFRVPPQSVCVYDQDEKKLYTFDGVIKIQQQMSLKIEEDPSKKKELYVNNARNEPDKVTLDVMMSDVYGDQVSGQLIVESTTFDTNSAQSIGSGGGNTRSSRAVNLLHTLKESRRMLTVVTPQYVYTDMLLQGVTVTQDDSCPFGWQGQLTFQEKYEETQKKDTTSSDGTTTNGETLTPANLYLSLGVIIK